LTFFAVIMECLLEIKVSCIAIILTINYYSFINSAILSHQPLEFNPI
jgi:hypothetical protein